MKMDGGDSPHFSSVTIKMIALAVAEENMFFGLHLYEHLNMKIRCSENA